MYMKERWGSYTRNLDIKAENSEFWNFLFLFRNIGNDAILLSKEFSGKTDQNWR